MKVQHIEGIGVANAKKLERVGIKTVSSLLKMCRDKKGRQLVSNETGFDSKTLLAWTNRADLMRVKGISTQYSDLLERVGVDTVKELAVRNADNLHAQMITINGDKRLVRRPPALSQVHHWVAQAKTLTPVITY